MIENAKNRILANSILIISQRMGMNYTYNDIINMTKQHAMQLLEDLRIEENK